MRGGAALPALTDIRGRRILVTGANGFLGSHLCRRLGLEGAEVHGVSRSVSARAEGIRWWREDLGDVVATRTLLRAVKPEIVFHLASHGVGAPGLEVVLPTVHSDFLTTINVLTTATELGVARLVLAASLEEPSPGTAESIPASPYAAAKWASTGYAQMFHMLYGTPIVIVRPFMTYGPGQRPYKIVPHVVLTLLRGNAPRLSSGRRPVDWVYVDDVIDGCLRAAQAPDVGGQIIDLGSGSLVPIRDVVTCIARLLESRVEPAFGALSDRPHERVRAADITVARRLLGWTAATTLENGLDQTIAWYRQHLDEFEISEPPLPERAAS